MATLDPLISKALHDIRNTYWAFMFLLENPDSIAPDIIKDQIKRDLAVMDKIEQEHRK